MGILRAILCLVVATILGGCGSILSTSEIQAASGAIERANTIDAEAYATYEYVSAEAYLDKAREEWGYSDFQMSVEYARRAREFALMAYERAMRHPRRGTPSDDPELDALDALHP